MDDESPDFKSRGEAPTNFGGGTPNQPYQQHRTPDYHSRGDQHTAAFEDLEETAPELATEQKSVALQPGDLIAERFEIIDQLGYGGMGAVYRVNDRQMNEERALKVMLPSLLQSRKAQSRFLEEVKVSQRLSHDSIVRVYDLVDDTRLGIQFFTMELIQGVTLGRMMHNSGGKLPVAQVVDIMNQLCDALAYAHQYTIHRDLKPQNIMVQPNGAIKILDFGLAKLMSPGRMNKSSMALGTAYYQAPEQSIHLQELDQRADIYSLGVILYQMLTGSIPVGLIKPPSTETEGVPASIDNACLKCLEPKMENRFDDVESLQHALNQPASNSASPLKMISMVVVIMVLAGSGVWWYSARLPSQDVTVKNVNVSSDMVGDESGGEIDEVPEETELNPDSTTREPEISVVQVIEAKSLAESSREEARKMDAMSYFPDEWSTAELSYTTAEGLDTRKEYSLAFDYYQSALQNFEALVESSGKRATELEAVDSARERMEVSKVKATKLEASKWASVTVERAMTLESSVSSVEAFQARIEQYNEIEKLYQLAVKEAEPIIAEIASLEKAKKAVKEARSKADDFRSEEYAASLYELANKSEKEADSIGSRPVKTQAYLQTASLYTDASVAAKKAYEAELIRLAQEKEKREERAQAMELERLEEQARAEQEALQEALQETKRKGLLADVTGVWKDPTEGFSLILRQSSHLITAERIETSTGERSTWEGSYLNGVVYIKSAAPAKKKKKRRLALSLVGGLGGIELGTKSGDSKELYLAISNDGMALAQVKSTESSTYATYEPGTKKVFWREP